MTARSFDQRLNQMHWQPTAIPSQKIVDDVLARRASVSLRVEWIVAGMVLGMLIGFGLKGTIAPDAPFGAHADTLGYVVGALCLLAAAASASLAILAIPLHKKLPQVSQFSLSNLLMIMVLLVS
ncbi:hypothetical protein KMP13_19685 [Epibacterium ulvae]|uniref:hypothetical protein n=1 Tax=Epibacterium ulvae TaxID=1156985 RepID=UPI001BFCBC16|nr:hypothetical protein [Epibacterium ulvae]MBT8156040.1 hypothetical protein [Epibacterium ulvae]